MKKSFFFLLCIASTLIAGSQVGYLDPAFGKNGIQTLSFAKINSLGEQGRGVLTMPDGKIIVLVYAEGTTKLAQYLSNGQLDITYGNEGFSNSIDIVGNAIALQGDKVLVVGRAPDCLLRFTADGALDSSFGVNGKVFPNIMGGAANAVLVQGDKIIVAGGGFNLLRYMANGSVDSTFGTNGVVITDFGNTDIDCNSIALQGDKIVAAGTSYDYEDQQGYFALARYTADGDLDPSFDGDGRVTTNINDNEDIAYTVLVQDDKIVAAGTASLHVALARYLSNGMLDPNFGVNGIVETAQQIEYAVPTAAILQDNKIIFAAMNFILRFDVNGVPDQSFGVNGTVTASYNPIAFRLAGDKILAAGHNGDFVLARYTANGVPDQSFGEKGIVTGYFASSASRITTAAIQGTKLVVAGTSGSNFGLARYKANGVLDSSFGVNGIVTTDFGTSVYRISLEKVQSILLQGNKIVTAGSASGRFALARYTANGVPDSSFGLNGQVIMRPNNMYGECNSAVLQGDKIVVAGRINADFGLARFMANGVLDSSFGVNGIVTTDFLGFDGAAVVLLQGDKIIAAGTTDDQRSANSRFALARYTAEGILDETFGTEGKVTTLFGNNFQAVTSALLQDGKILVAGIGTIARYTADGQLDKSFGENGVVNINASGFSIGQAIALQGGKIIATGALDGKIALIRYTADGGYDNSFGSNGIRTYNLGGYCFADHLIVQDGRLILVGFLQRASDVFGLVSAFQLEKEEAMKISDFTLVNASNEQDVQKLSDGAVLDLSLLPQARFNIRANTSPGKVGSVFFELKGAKTLKHTENGKPYSLNGDNQGDYFGLNLQAGEYTLTATPYSNKDGKGEKGIPLTIHFKLVYPALVTSFTLVNAETGQDIQDIKNDDILNLFSLPTHVNIRANTSPSTVGSVVLNLSGQQSHQQAENLFPYALFGGSPYNAWTPEAGSYTLTATPYSATKGRGAKAEAYTVHFSVMSFLPLVIDAKNAKQKSLEGKLSQEKFGLSATPNPISSSVRLQYHLSSSAYIEVKLYNALGQNLGTAFSGQLNAGTYNTTYNTSKLSKGVYFCRMLATTVNGKNVVQTINLVKAE